MSPEETRYSPLDIEARGRELERDRERRRLELDQELADIRWLAGRKQGRRILHRLIVLHAGVLRYEAPGDALRSAFAEGRRSVGLLLLGQIEQQIPGQFAVMLTEAINDAKRSRAAESVADPEPRPGPDDA